MTEQTEPSKQQESTLTGAAYVAQYLGDHPDFFFQHRDLLMQLNVPHEAGTVSLVERQVKALRDRNRELQSQMIDMLRNARENERLLSQCLALALSLINSTSPAELLQILRVQLLADFQIDAFSVLLCDHQLPVPAGARDVEHEILLASIGCEFPDGEPVCGLLEKPVREFLFGELKPDLQSVALLPLGPRAERGVIAIASRSNERFVPQMGTVFLQLIGNLFDALLRRHGREIDTRENGNVIL